MDKELWLSMSHAADYLKIPILFDALVKYLAIDRPDLNPTEQAGAVFLGTIGSPTIREAINAAYADPQLKQLKESALKLQQK